MKGIFNERDVQYDLRSKNHLQLPNVKTAKHGIENTQYLGHHLWASLPEEIKDSGTLTTFKQKIKSWKGSTCICRLCKHFYQWSRVFISFSLLSNLCNFTV